MNTSCTRLALILVVFLSGGCSASRDVMLAEKVFLMPLNIPYNVHRVEIIDKRERHGPHQMLLPVVSRPNQLIKHEPSLTTAHEKLIADMIWKNTVYSEDSVRAVLTIKEAYKEFSSTWISEKERGYALLQISFFDLASGKQISECESSGEFWVQSMDATVKRMENVYQVSLSNALYSCLKKVRGQAKERVLSKVE